MSVCCFHTQGGKDFFFNVCFVFHREHPFSTFLSKLRRLYTLSKGVEGSARRSFQLPGPLAVQISFRTSASILFVCLFEVSQG